MAFILPSRLNPEELEGPPIEQLLRRGLEHHQAGRLPEAVKAWMELARRRPYGGMAEVDGGLRK